MSFFSRKKNHAPPPQNNAQQQQPSAPPPPVQPQVVQRQIVKEPSYERYSFSLFCAPPWQRLPELAYPKPVINPNPPFPVALTDGAALLSLLSQPSSTLLNPVHSLEVAVRTPLPAMAQRNLVRRWLSRRLRTTSHKFSSLSHNRSNPANQSNALHIRGRSVVSSSHRPLSSLSLALRCRRRPHHPRSLGMVLRFLPLRPPPANSFCSAAWYGNKCGTTCICFRPQRCPRRCCKLPARSRLRGWAMQVLLSEVS